MPKDRDRDQQGRAKNSRPRDSLGRPLPRDAVGDPAAMIEPSGTAEELLAQGISHFNSGRYFQAHECWETAWHPSDDNEREFWQGITQIAVGYTHKGRGNPTGAVTLLRRGAARLAPYGASYRGISIGELAKEALDAADQIEREGVRAEVPTPRVNSYG